jgi:hypothetical protein
MRRMTTRILICLILGFSVVATPAIASGNDLDCKEIVSADLNSTLRGSGNGSDCQRIAVEVWEPGVLALTLSAKKPLLIFAGESRGLDESDRRNILSLERSASQWILAVAQAGTYFFRVVNADPRQPLGSYKLDVGFVALEASVASASYGFQKAGSASVDEREPEPEGVDEREPEPEGVDEREPEPEGVDEREPEPEGATNSLLGSGKGSAAANVELSHLNEVFCAAVASDDHARSFDCATGVDFGAEMPGEIANGWGDDEDLFRFVLPGSPGFAAWTVDITTSGGLDTLGTLYDDHGHRLVEDDGSDRGNFHIVRTLEPGVYFVRVEGRHGSEGAYRLRLDAIPK